MSQTRSLPAFLTVLLVSTISLAQSRPMLPDDEAPLRNWPIAVNAMNRASTNAGIPESDALPSAASHFIAMVPCRVYDSRVVMGGPGPIPATTARTITVGGGACAGVPTSAAGFSLNITVTGSTGSGNAFVTAYPTGSMRPGTSTVNFQAGTQVANAAIVPAGAAGAIDIYASTQTEVIVDINGYLVEGVVTNIVPGSGLSGGGTGNVGLSVATGGITNAHIATGAAIPESKLALNYPTHSNTNDPTLFEKNAMAGTSGVPSTANRFVTDVDTRNTNARVPLVHGSSAHDSTVASRVGGLVPPAQLGTGAANSSVFLTGASTYAQVNTPQIADGAVTASKVALPVVFTYEYTGYYTYEYTYSLGAHVFCALAKVQLLHMIDSGTNTWCYVSSPSPGQWSLSVRGNGSSSITCQAVCF